MSATSNTTKLHLYNTCHNLQSAVQNLLRTSISKDGKYDLPTPQKGGPSTFCQGKLHILQHQLEPLPHHWRFTIPCAVIFNEHIRLKPCQSSIVLSSYSPASTTFLPSPAFLMVTVPLSTTPAANSTSPSMTSLAHAFSEGTPLGMRVSIASTNL
mmetsp:Transcript_13380/g.25284  ORF Transcript_13380/g.25284 Transcript_13380/m.25284 type:complete len:155 (-) Transcript_13380:1423-1887(-)